MELVKERGAGSGSSGSGGEDEKEEEEEKMEEKKEEDGQLEPTCKALAHAYMRQLIAQRRLPLPGMVDLLVGGPPCQSVSACFSVLPILLWGFAILAWDT